MTNKFKNSLKELSINLSLNIVLDVANFCSFGAKNVK